MEIFEEAFMQGFSEGLEKVGTGRFRAGYEAVKETAKKVPGWLKNITGVGEIKAGLKQRGVAKELLEGAEAARRPLTGNAGKAYETARGEARRLLTRGGLKAGATTAAVGGGVGLGAALRKRKKKGK